MKVEFLNKSEYLKNNGTSYQMEPLWEFFDKEMLWIKIISANKLYEQWWTVQHIRKIISFLDGIQTRLFVFGATALRILSEFFSH
jgi:intein-encoded DNA endonuclease-like protein